MAVLDNRSPFCSEMVPVQDANGQLYLVVVVRGTFSIGDAGVVSQTGEQEPVQLEDSYVGKPGESSVRFASDFGLSKSGTDVVMLGTAYAPSQQPTTNMSVALSVGSLKKRVVVFGDRQWTSTLGMPSISRPRPFLKMPLLYELAFGGSDRSHRDPAKHVWEQRNPIGKGFHKYRSFVGVFLPNIEDLENVIQTPLDRPVPQGFGFIDRHWEPRRSFAGTYDETWRKEQCPLLPLDFDARYFQSAHPELVSEPKLSGDEPVRITGAVPKGDLTFCLPGLSIGVAVHNTRGRVSRGIASLETLVLRPDERRFNLVWRYTILCRRTIFEIVRVVIFPIHSRTALALAREISLGGRDGS